MQHQEETWRKWP